MAEDELTTLMHRFHDNLVNAGFKPLHIYVFGSQVSGKATEDSDIDVMVVLPEPLELTDVRFGRTEVVAYRTDPRIEAWFVGEKEFNELDTPIISTVRQHGKLIKAA